VIYAVLYLQPLGVWEIRGVKVWGLPLKRLVTLTTVLR